MTISAIQAQGLPRGGDTQACGWLAAKQAADALNTSWCNESTSEDEANYNYFGEGALIAQIRNQVEWSLSLPLDACMAMELQVLLSDPHIRAKIAEERGCDSRSGRHVNASNVAQSIKAEACRIMERSEGESMLLRALSSLKPSKTKAASFSIMGIHGCTQLEPSDYTLIEQKLERLRQLEQMTRAEIEVLQEELGVRMEDGQLRVAIGEKGRFVNVKLSSVHIADVRPEGDDNYLLIRYCLKEDNGVLSLQEEMRETVGADSVLVRKLGGSATKVAAALRTMELEKIAFLIREEKESAKTDLTGNASLSLISNDVSPGELGELCSFNPALLQAEAAMRRMPKPALMV